MDREAKQRELEQLRNAVQRLEAELALSAAAQAGHLEACWRALAAGASVVIANEIIVSVLEVNERRIRAGVEATAWRWYLAQEQSASQEPVAVETAISTRAAKW